ncbi:MAG: hypothetical protein LAT64_00780 [Phycisphaerales bacterium]|nr:hypothetical protein [Planctomycetota bacterium]MCH8507296.1 hypothetical protein [Phycisphaerales bacterium]
MTEPRQTARHPQVLLHDLTSELLWTRALRTPALALRPGRVMLGMAAVFLATLIGNISAVWSSAPDDDQGRAEQLTFGQAVAEPITAAFSNAVAAVTSLSAPRFLDAVASLAMLPGRLLYERPVDTIVLGLPIVLVFVLFGGAISRSVATEFAAARITEWPDDLRVSGGKLGWSFAAIIGPIAIASLLLGLIMLGGFTLGIPIVNLIGSVLYAIGLLLAFAALALLVLHALALPMIVPALMAEGTDGYDAVQRSYAYVLARPLRLLTHGLILLVLGAASVAIAHALAGGTIAMTDWAAERLSTDATGRVLTGEGELAATQPAAHAIIQGWRKLVEIIVSGFVFSYFFAAGTVLYLHARRICDGQGTGDIWLPSTTQD